MCCLYFPVMKTANYLQCLSSCQERHTCVRDTSETCSVHTSHCCFYVVFLCSHALVRCLSDCILQHHIATVKVGLWSIKLQPSLFTFINNYICNIIVSRAGNTHHDGEDFTNVCLTVTLRLYPKNQIWMVSSCSSRQLNIIYIALFTIHSVVYGKSLFIFIHFHAF